MKNKKLIILIVLFLSVVLLPITYSKYTKKVSNTITLSVAQPTYTVVFHSNLNPDTITSQNFTYGTAQQLNANTFTNGNLIFKSWNTAADGTGTTYQNGQQVNNLTNVNNDIVDLYAQWTSNVCEVNGVEYLTINECLSHITGNQQTELRMLADVVLGVNDRIHVDNGKNVLLNLNGHTISNEQGVNIPILEAVGTVTVRNGTLTCSAKQAVINLDQSTGRVYIENATIAATGTGSNGRQAIYNNAGYLEIRDGAVITAVATARAAVQTQANGTTVILGGTITGSNYYGVQNAGSLTIGTQGTPVSRTNPEIRGATYGVYAISNFDLYE